MKASLGLTVLILLLLCAFPGAQAIAADEAAKLEHETKRFSVSADVSALTWSPDGKYLAVSFDQDRKISLIMAENGRSVWTVRKRLGLYPPPQRALKFSPDGSLIYTPSAITFAREEIDKTVSVVSTRDGQIVRTLAYQPAIVGQALATDIAVSGDGRRIFAMPGMDGNVLQYETGSWAVAKNFNVPIDRTEINKSPSHSRLALDEVRNSLWVAHSGMVRRLQANDGKVLLTFQAFDVSATVLAINKATGELVMGGSDVYEQSRFPINDAGGMLKDYKDDSATLVRAFDPQTGHLVRTYLGAGGSVEGLSVSPDGLKIAATKARQLGVSPSWLLLWDARDGKLLAAKDFGQAQVGDVAFSPDGSLLAYAVANAVHVIKIAE